MVTATPVTPIAIIIVVSIPITIARKVITPIPTRIPAVI